MSKKEMPVNTQPHVWKQLVSLHGRRGTAKNRVTDLTTRRGQTEKELRELGAGETAEHKDLALQLWRTNESLKKEREGIAWLADQVDEVIEKGLQGELYRAPAEMPSDDDDEPEEEPELLKNAREEREKRKGEAPTNALGDPLQVGQVYRFTSKATPERWMEGRLNRLHAGTTMVTVDAFAFDPEFGAKAVKGKHDLNTAAVTWAVVKGSAEPQPETKPDRGISTADIARMNEWKFPGTFVFRALRHGVAPTRHEFGDADAMHTKLAELCGLEATPEQVCLNLGGSVMIRLPDTAKQKDAWQSVGTVSQVESEAEAAAADAQAETDKEASKKGAKLDKAATAPKTKEPAAAPPKKGKKKPTDAKGAKKAPKPAPADEGGDDE